MSVLSVSGPADHSEYGIEWPWVPYSRYPQLRENFAPDDYREKMALVERIAKIYERPAGDEATQRQFTGWQNAIFYSLSPATLRSVAPFPQLVKSLGENAKTFGALGKSSSMAENAVGSRMLTFRTSAVIRGSIDSDSTGGWGSTQAIDMSEKVRRAIDRRDRTTCIVTGVKGLVDHTRIVPLEVSFLHGAAFESIFRVGDLFFHHSFRKYLDKCFKSLHDAGDKRWNVLSLSPNIRSLFDRGLIGFKPLHVATDRSGPVKTYLATFSFHFIGRNQIDFNERATPGDAATFCKMLSREEAATHPYDANYCRLNGCRRNDGKVIQIPFKHKAQAQDMLSMLALRWAAGALWYLAGATGLGPDDDLDSEEVDTELQGMTWLNLD